MRTGVICAFLILCVSLNSISADAAEELKEAELYAQSAVLMDAESGRVLYEKNGYEIKPMASTTKIMTCIVALENADTADIVTASAYAARQPKVHLGVTKGETFQLKNLLYSLMLESHNDSAVAIAEHIGGGPKESTEESKKAVAQFAKMMNQKARDLGCFDTYFITPNGLDAEAVIADGSKKIHSTTAADLAKIMSYCIKKSPKKEEFLEITRTASYSFSDEEGKRTFSCNNHNAFLHMMEGALSGKTGFTNQAGYCYIGALEREGRTFVVALLACGWPNNKTYKWSDMRKIMNYALEHYEYRDVWEDQEFLPIQVLDGIPKNGDISQKAEAPIAMNQDVKKELRLLLKEEDQITIKKELKKVLTAPVKAGETVGSVKYYLNGKVVNSYPVMTVGDVDKIGYKWCFCKVLLHFFV